MAPKKLVFIKKGVQKEKQQTADEEPADEEAEPEEIGSACSSPTASKFIVVPAVKPIEKKKKKSPTGRKFPDEDVIALLKGLAVFWANGRNNKWAEFHNFIKDNLTNQYTKIQVSEKIRSLKKKLDRARANEAQLDFSDSNELAVFELSKALWGDEKGVVHEESNGKARKGEQLDEGNDGSKKSRKRKQLDTRGKEKNKVLEQGKELDEHYEDGETEKEESNKKPRKMKRLDECDEENKILEQGKELDDHNEEEGTAEKAKQEDEDEDCEKTKILKQGKNENNAAEKGKQDFQSAFPLLYASFDRMGYSKYVKEKCISIPWEKAQELEEKWRELNADTLRLELRRIELVKRDLEDCLQRK